MAGQLEDAKAAYQQGGYATAMRLIAPLAPQAQQGDAASEVALGVLYFFGQGRSAGLRGGSQVVSEGGRAGLL